MSEQNNNNSETIEVFDRGSCDAILDTAKTIYNEESERFKQAVAKTNITIAFVGVLFGTYLTFLGTFEPITNEFSYLIYTYIFKATIFVLLIVGITMLLKSIGTGQYDQVSLEKIVEDSLGNELESITKLKIAATYKEAIDNNKALINNKMDCYNKGLKLVFWSFLIFAGHFVIEEVIQIVY